MTSIPVGSTQHFEVSIESQSFKSPEEGTKVGNGLLQTCEADYAQLRSMFSKTDIPRVVKVKINNLAGGVNNGQDMTIGDGGTGRSGDFDRLRNTFIAELSEIFMRVQNKKWNPSDSKGEALSRALGGFFYPGGQQPGFSVHQWVDNDPDNLNPSGDKPTGPEGLEDWINVTEPTDTRAKSIGCGVAFINYLHFQLGIPLVDIIAQEGTTLAEIYDKLVQAGKVPDYVSGKSAFEPFAALVRSRFPRGTPSGLNATNKTPNSDQFFPLEIYLDIFVLGQDGVVRHGSRENLRWKWSSVDNAGFNQGTPISALRRVNALDIFVLGMDNMIRTAFRDNAGWHWSTIDGAAFNQGNPITVVSNSGIVDIFVLGMDSMIRTAFRDDAGWHWSTIGGAAFNQGNPIAAVRNGDALDIFALGTDNMIRTAYRDDAGWHWSMIGGAAFNQKSPITVVQYRDEMDIFILGTDDVIRTAFRDNAGWHWAAIAGQTFNQGSAITAVRSGSEVDIFALGKDGMVWTAFRDNAGWHWSRIEGAAFNQGNPIAAVRSGDALDIFILGKDNMVRTAFRDSTGWHWSTIDGAAFNQGNPITAIRNFGH